MVSFVTPSIAFSAGLHILTMLRLLGTACLSQPPQAGTPTGVHTGWDADLCVVLLTLAQASRILGYRARMLAVLKAVATDLRTAFQRSPVGPVSSV